MKCSRTGDLTREIVKSVVWTKSVDCAGAPSYYQELLDKLQNEYAGAVGPSLTASLEDLAHHRNIASISL